MECSTFGYGDQYKAGILVFLVLVMAGLLLFRRRRPCGLPASRGGRDEDAT
jgi:hypothetical protein